MKKNISGFEIIIKDNYLEICKEAACIIKDQIESNPTSVLGLATGSTPLGIYSILIDYYKNEKLDFSKTKSFNLDEYYPIDNKNINSYNHYMNENLFNDINIKKENINIPNGLANEPKDECILYDKKIQDAGGIDIQLLGIGLNGHIGFNEPSDFFCKNTHLVKLDESTIKANSRFFDNYESVPKYAITMGIKAIFESKKIILVVSGKEKANILSELLYGEISPKIQASILQLHKNTVIIADKEATIKIIQPFWINIKGLYYYYY